MVETSKLHMCESEIEQLEISEVNSIVIPEEVLQVHGYAPPKKAEGTVQRIYENVNGFINGLSGNEKVDKAKEIHDELKVDIAAYCEHQLNMRHKKRKWLQSIIQRRGGRGAVYSFFMRILVGLSTGVQVFFYFGPLTEQLEDDEIGKDDTGLGRWSVITLQGAGVRTREWCAATTPVATAS